MFPPGGILNASTDSHKSRHKSTPAEVKSFVTKQTKNVTKHPWSHPASVVTFFFCLVTKLFTEAGVDLCLVLWLSVLAFKYLPGGYAHDD